MADEKSIRYDNVIATLIGLLAICVAAYTAYIQRQQVRAQVWPVLELSTSNEPFLEVSLANKGVGPALIRHVIITVDGKPVTTWKDCVEHLLGPGHYSFSQETIGNRFVSAGEKMNALSPREYRTSEGLKVGPEGSLGARFNVARFRIGAEICYCSTLDDCWTLYSRLDEEPRVVETRRCPARSAITFQQ
jgi:hypothetical protein